MRAPLDRMTVTPHGAYLYDRGGGSIHYGVDLRGGVGTPIYAPEAMTVLYAGVEPLRRPLRRFRPGAIIAEGASGVFYLFGHIDPEGATPGRKYAEGERIGTIGDLKSGPHLHLEVRTEPAPPGGPARKARTMDPIAWFRANLVEIPPQGTAPSSRDRGNVKPAKSGGGVAALAILLVGVYLLGDRR